MYSVSFIVISPSVSVSIPPSSIPPFLRPSSLRLRGRFVSILPPSSVSDYPALYVYQSVSVSIPPLRSSVPPFLRSSSLRLRDQFVSILPPSSPPAASIRCSMSACARRFLYRINYYPPSSPPTNSALNYRVSIVLCTHAPARSRPLIHPAVFIGLYRGNYYSRQTPRGTYKILHRPISPTHR